MPEAVFPLAISAIFRNATDQVLSFYKVAAGGWRDTRDSLSYVLTDYWFKCSSARMATAFDRAGLKAFVYRFQHVLSFGKMFPVYGLPVVCENRTCHASEVPFVFHNHANYSFDKDELILADAFIAYWCVSIFTC